MLRLLIKILLTPIGVASFFFYFFIGLMLFDQRALDNPLDLLEIIWSDNQPIDFKK